MSDALRGVVVCHGGLAKALVEAAESISGVTGVLLPVSNSGCDRDSLETRVSEAVDGRPSVIFVDLASGSCLFAVLKRMRALAGVKVVTGVNLAMLVDFVFHVSLTPEAAAERAIAAGTKAIRIP
ncbi:MAG: PTS sugar transporter subunit IIA [Candidatus Limnocylindria bacterium]